MKKTPIQHKVKSHYRDGKLVAEYQRGKGSRTERSRRVVGSIPSFDVQEKVIKEKLPGAEFVEYSEDHGQIEVAVEDLDAFKEKMKELGYVVKDQKYWETGGVRAIATKQGYAPIVLLEF